MPCFQQLKANVAHQKRVRMKWQTFLHRFIHAYSCKKIINLIRRYKFRKNYKKFKILKRNFILLLLPKIVAKRKNKEKIRLSYENETVEEFVKTTLKNLSSLKGTDKGLSWI
jgi:hypothetical protein